MAHRMELHRVSSKEDLQTLFIEVYNDLGGNVNIATANGRLLVLITENHVELKILSERCAAAFRNRVAEEVFPLEVLRGREKLDVLPRGVYQQLGGQPGEFRILNRYEYLIRQGDIALSIISERCHAAFIATGTLPLREELPQMEVQEDFSRFIS